MEVHPRAQNDRTVFFFFSFTHFSIFSVRIHDRINNEIHPSRCVIKPSFLTNTHIRSKSSVNYDGEEDYAKDEVVASSERQMIKNFPRQTRDIVCCIVHVVRTQHIESPQGNRKVYGDVNVYYIYIYVKISRAYIILSYIVQTIQYKVYEIQVGGIKITNFIFFTLHIAVFYTQQRLFLHVCMSRNTP